MSEEQSKIKFKAIAKLVKYADNVTQEEIDNGVAIPLEVIESEDDLWLTPNEAKDLGLEI